MLRNWPFQKPHTVLATFLNEVLSLNAQELVDTNGNPSAVTFSSMKS